MPWPLIRVLSPAFSQVLENTAFFGDVVLRFPRIVHHYFDHNSNWNLLIRWGISFCNQSGVFDQGPHSPILSLVRTGAQEGRSPVSPCTGSLASACSRARMAALGHIFCAKPWHVEVPPQGVLC